MIHKILYLLTILAFLSLINCSKKEEPIQTEEKVSSFEPELESEDEEPSAQEIANPTIPSPKGYRNIKEAIGDLDGDKEDELAIVYDSQKKGDLGNEREIHIFKKAGDKWNLFNKSSGAVLPSLAGGMMLDPFEDISIKNGTLIITHFGGSRQKWNYLHRFKLQKDQWILIGATTVTGSPCETFTTYDYNLLTGKVNSIISKESCDEAGEPKGKPKDTKASFTIKSKSNILMDGFEPGGNEIKIPASKGKSFYF